MIDVDLTSEQTATLSSSGLDVASVGMQDVPWDNVGIDNVAAAKEATNRLLALGHSPSGRRSNRQRQDPRHRRAETGVRVGPSRTRRRRAPDWVIEAGYTIEGGRQAMSELLRRRGNLPTAVFAGCDEVAFGALMALKEHGLSCPEDISIR